MSRFLGTALLLVCGCGSEELSVNETVTTQTWVVTSYRTGGIERIEGGDGCLKDDAYTFADGGTANLNLGVSCPDGTTGIYPHLTTGTWTLDEEGFLEMSFTSAERADCQMTFSGRPEVGKPFITFGFSQPCTNTVAQMELTAQ